MGKSAFSIVMDSRKELVEQIIHDIQQGDIPWRKGWINRPYNPYSQSANNGYHGGNSLKLMLAANKKGYVDNRWMTFHQATQQGYKIKPGEKGVLLEKWIFGQNRTVKNEKGENEEIYIEYKSPIVNYFVVFNGEQLEGLPPITKEHDNNLTALISSIEKSSECPILHQGDKACYSPKTDKITIPPIDKFVSDEEYLSTLLHEMSHSTGHSSRLNRELINSFGTKEYAKEELRAELGSIFTGMELGVNPSESVLKNNEAYLQSWVDVLSNDYNELFRAANDADNICHRLSNNYQNQIQIEQEGRYHFSFHVDECTEFPHLGKTYSDLSLKEAMNILQTLPKETQNMIPSISIDFKDNKESFYDTSVSVVYNNRIDLDALLLCCPEVLAINEGVKLVADIIEMNPNKEIVGIIPEVLQKELDHRKPHQKQTINPDLSH